MADPEELQAPIDDVGDDVRAAFEQHRDEIAETLKEPGETAEQKAERARNERGQFVAKESTVEQADAAPEKPITDADQSTEQLTEQSRAPEPPRGWSADEKALWASLPPAIHAAVSRREQEMDAGARQWSEQRQQLEQTFAPVQSLSQQYQMPPLDVVSRLVTVEQKLQKDPAKGISELAQAYGVDLAALVNGTPQPQTRAAPQIDSDAIKQMVDSRLSEAEQARQQKAQLDSTINGFATEKDASGKLMHEHFNSVKVLMGHLIQSGQAADMQTAYDMAVYATPATREKLLSSQSQIVVNRGQVDKAKKAAVSKRGAPSTAHVNGKAPDYETVDDAVRAAVASVRGE